MGSHGTPLAPHWPPNGFPMSPMGPQWDPMGAQWAPWAPNGFPMELHGARMGCPWPPMAPHGRPIPNPTHGCLGVPWGAFLDFDENWTSLSEQMGSKYAACHQKRASRNSWDTAHTAHTEHTDTLSTQEVLLRAPLLHAPGARMTVVELTPSNYWALLGYSV